MEQSINQTSVANNGIFLTAVVSGTLFFSGNVLNNKNVENSFNYWVPNASKTSHFINLESIANSDVETNKKNRFDHSMTVVSAESREAIYMNDDNHLTQRDYDALQKLIDTKKEALENKIESTANDLKAQISSAKEDVITEVQNNKKFTITTWISIISCLVASGSLIITIIALFK
jgi:outer membrane murein-binding lipoprotein Lpp